MRILLCIAWLILPVLGFAWHYGPGQDCFRGDQAQLELVLARKAVTADQHTDAIEHFSAALKSLPEGQPNIARQIRVEKAKSMMRAQRLGEANADLEALVDEMESDKAADGTVLADAKSTLANSQYYTTWVMRLHGYAREVWEPEIEAARQTYRWLAENAKAKGQDDVAMTYSQDCESSIRLARMDVSELQGLALPCQCCCNGNCKKPGSAKKPGKKPGKQPNDQFARGAGAGPPPDGSGH